MKSLMGRFRSVALNSDVALAVLLESFNLVWFKCKPVCGQCQSMKSSTYSTLLVTQVPSRVLGCVDWIDLIDYCQPIEQ